MRRKFPQGWLAFGIITTAAGFVMVPMVMRPCLESWALWGMCLVSLVVCFFLWLTELFRG